jgi:membrane protease subunit HflC
MRATFAWIIGLLVVVLVSSAFFTVDETEVAIVTRFGRPLDGLARPGLHVKWPWPIETVVRLDSRLLVFDNEPTEMLTRDKKNVLIDSFICWRIADPLRFAQTVRTRAEAEARLLDISAAELGSAVGSEPMESFIGVEAGRVQLREISARVAAAMNRISGQSLGIEVVDLQINGFNLPAQNRVSVVNRMRAERARMATRYRSEGEEEALKIEAQATAEREKILAEARSQAEAVRGAGEAEAMSIFAAAYGKDPEFYKFLRTLQSYESIIDEKTTVFLESDSRLMSVLHGP